VCETDHLSFSLAVSVILGIASTGHFLARREPLN
jgi:hypothetical protein